MQYRKMGKSGLKLSTISLGSWYTLGTSVDVNESIKIIQRAWELGINFFDTANVYTSNWGSGEGEVESILGKAVKDYPRHSYVICTKVRGKMGEGPNAEGLSYKHIIEQCEGSLKRLGLDHIDIYMCHRAHPATPVEEIVRAMDYLQKQGKICYWATSNWKAWRIQQALRACDQIGAAPIACTEPRYNLLFRYPEIELFPATRDEGLGHVVFSPLAQGMLTGKYHPGEPLPSGSRAADEHDGKYMRGIYISEWNKHRSQELASMAGDLGVSTGNLALAWILHNKQVTSAITGAKNAQQVEQNVKAADIQLTDEIYEKINDLFPVPRGPWLREGEIPRDLADWQERELQLQNEVEISV